MGTSLRLKNTRYRSTDEDSGNRVRGKVCRVGAAEYFVGHCLPLK